MTFPTMTAGVTQASETVGNKVWNILGQTYMPKQLCDTQVAPEVLVCLSAESRGEVDALVAKAVQAGGSIYKEPMDFGFMYGHSFQDLDGHQWELMYMEANSIPQ